MNKSYLALAVALIALLLIFSVSATEAEDHVETDDEFDLVAVTMYDQLLSDIPPPFDCIPVPCAMVKCHPNAVSFTPRDENGCPLCPKCIVKCPMVKCQAPNCTADQVLFTPVNKKTGCRGCPICQKKGTTRACPPPPPCAYRRCAAGEVMVTPKNEQGCIVGCGQCQKPVCPMYKCMLPKCKEDEKLFTPKNENGCSLCPKCTKKEDETPVVVPADKNDRLTSKCMPPPCAMQRNCKRTEPTTMMQNGIKCPGCPRCVEFAFEEPVQN